MNSRHCDNGANHAHFSKGSMKAAHNTDDRVERAQFGSASRDTSYANGLAALRGKDKVTLLIAKLMADKAAREANISVSVSVLSGQSIKEIV